MAARKRNWTPEIVRQRIRTSMLVNRLQNHVLGKGKNNVMARTQVAAAEILLRKCLPDLNRTELTGEGGGPVQHVGIVTDDPIEAGRQYQRMVNGQD